MFPMFFHPGDLVNTAYVIFLMFSLGPGLIGPDSSGGKLLGFAEEVGDPGEWMQAAVQEGEAEQAVAAWQNTMDARIHCQGLTAAIDAWAVAWVDPAELTRQAAIYSVEWEQE